MGAAGDEALARRAKDGERRAYDLLVGRYARPMLNFFGRSVGTLEQAEELWQQCFVTAYDRLHTFDDARKFRPWLYGIAMNLLRNAWRSMAAMPFQLDVELADRLEAPGQSPDEAAADREVAEVIWEGVRQLSEEQRAVFMLRIYHGLGYAEIAEILECPEGTAKSRMHFAGESIRKHLKARDVS